MAKWERVLPEGEPGKRAGDILLAHSQILITFFGGDERLERFRRES